MTISVPSFVHLTVVAGEVVEVQIRVNWLVDVLLCTDVTTGSAEEMDVLCSAQTDNIIMCCTQAYNYSQSWV